MLELTSIPTRNSKVIGKMTDDEAVLVMPQKGQVKVLNEVGAEIWELIDGKRNIDNIVDEIYAQFNVDRRTATADALNFITELIERDIVSIISS